jgi:hypothetical protein
MLNRIATIIASLLVPMALLATPTAANASPASIEVSKVKEFANGTVRYEKADRAFKVRELRYFEHSLHGFAYVEFNDGSAWAFAPCEYEDSSACFWDAGFRGNRIGTSFIRYGGKTFRL